MMKYFFREFFGPIAPTLYMILAWIVFIALCFLAAVNETFAAFCTIVSAISLTLLILWMLWEYIKDSWSRAKLRATEDRRKL